MKQKKKHIPLERGGYAASSLQCNEEAQWKNGVQASAGGPDPGVAEELPRPEGVRRQLRHRTPFLVPNLGDDVVGVAHHVGRSEPLEHLTVRAAVGEE